MTSISASIPSHNSLLLFGHDTPAPFEFHEFTTVTSWISLIIFTLMALIRVYKLLSIRSIIIEFVVSASITVRETHFYDIHKLSWINSKIYTPLANTNVCLFVCLLGLKSWYIQINYLLMTTTVLGKLPSVSGCKALAPVNEKHVIEMKVYRLEKKQKYFPKYSLRYLMEDQSTESRELEKRFKLENTPSSKGRMFHIRQMK